MSSCSVNRWGPGTTKERPPNTHVAKEIEARMAEMSRERDKQDSIWTQNTVSTKNTIDLQNIQKLQKK